MGLIKKHYLKLIFAGLALVFAAGVVLLNNNISDILNLSQKRLLGVAVRYERARVSSVMYDDTVPDTIFGGGLREGKQNLTAELLTGPHKGDEVQLINLPELIGNVYLGEGDDFIAKVRESESGEYMAEVSGYNRAPVLMGLIGLFFLLIILVGGKKGVKSLVGLMFTLVCVCYVFLPLIFRGVDSLPAAILIAVLASFVTLALTGGWNRKSAAAIAGTIAGVVAASVIALLTAMIAKITVFNTTDVEPLTLLVYDIPLKLNNILFAGVIIAALGAVMDVAISVASAVNEIHSVAENTGCKQLFSSGMNIGRDMIGTMSNTLILAFTGSSVNLLILLYAYDLPFNQLLNLDMLAIEVLQAIVGSIGIILTIPITAYITSALISRKNQA